jgi:two-component system, response regulator
MAEPCILLVDDDRNDEELARIALEDAAIPHELTIARDGARALEMLFPPVGPDVGSGVADPRPTLVLLDLKLPKVGGLEILDRIRKDNRTRLLPVVVFTSSNEESDLFAAYLRGANAYVRKPVDFREYRALIVAVATFWIRYNQRPPGPANVA